MKYAERGFGIAVPLLKSCQKIDRDWLSFKRERCPWNNEWGIGGDGWDKWTCSVNLERLLLAERLASVKGGYIEKPFKGRMRGEIGRDKASRAGELQMVDR